MTDRTKKVLKSMAVFTAAWFIAFFAGEYVSRGNATWYQLAVFWISVLCMGCSGGFIVMEYVEYLDWDNKGRENE